MDWQYSILQPVAMLFEYFDLKEEGTLIRKAVDASLDENVRTPEIQVEGGAKYGTKEVGSWIVDYIKKAQNFIGFLRRIRSECHFTSDSLFLLDKKKYI